MIGLLLIGFLGMIFFTSIDGKESLFPHFTPNASQEDQTLDIATNTTFHTVAVDTSK